jgi:hypothetical protein
MISVTQMKQKLRSLRKKLTKAIDRDILDPFGKEEAFKDEENAEENCSFPCGFDLDKSNEKLCPRTSKEKLRGKNWLNTSPRSVGLTSVTKYYRFFRQ